MRKPLRRLSQLRAIKRVEGCKARTEPVEIGFDPSSISYTANNENGGEDGIPIGRSG
jgi:hypothetical protein